MFEKLISGSISDFRQRYEGTFGFYVDRTKGKRFLARLDRVLERERQVVFVDSSEISYKLNADVVDDIGFEFISPRSYCYNTAKGVSVVSRIAQRQFRRGITHANTAIKQFDARRSRWYAQEVDFSSLLPIFDNPIDTTTAFRNFKQKKVGCFAPAPQFTVTTSFVFFFDELIGTVEFNKDFTQAKISLNKDGLVETELRDCLRQLGVTVSYTVDTAKKPPESAPKEEGISFDDLDRIMIDDEDEEETQ